jgi:N-acetylmuramoyl-L-alanine amidase
MSGFSNPIGSRQERAQQLRAEMEQAKAQAEEALSEANDAASSSSSESKIDEPVGQGDYVVKQGDCMSSIAKDTGHFWETIWNDGANSELQSVRKDPNTLMPGDRVTIPEKKPKNDSGATEQRHRFVRKGEPAKLRVQLVFAGEPLANQPYKLVIDGSTTHESTTDAVGNIDPTSIPGNARRGDLYVGPEDEQVHYELKLGSMGPKDAVRGAQERLRNLGFGAPDSGVADAQTQAAVRAFQEHTETEVTGELDEAVMGALKDAHGS